MVRKEGATRKRIAKKEKHRNGLAGRSNTKADCKDRDKRKPFVIMETRKHGLQARRGTKTDCKE